MTARKINIYSEPSVRTDTHKVTIVTEGPFATVRVDGHKIDVTGYTVSQDAQSYPEVTLEVSARHTSTTKFAGQAHATIAEESADALAAIGWAEPITDADRLDDLARHADETVSGWLVAALNNGSATYRSTIVDGTVRWYRRGAPLTERRATSAELTAEAHGRGGPVRVWLP